MSVDQDPRTMQYRLRRVEDLERKWIRDAAHGHQPTDPAFELQCALDGQTSAAEMAYALDPE